MVDASKVRVAVTGAVSKGATSATAPTGTASTLTGFKDLGGINEDGVELTLPGTGDATPIKVWQNGATVRTIRETTDDLPSVSFVMVETTVETVETYFGVSVTRTATEGSFEYKVSNRTADSYVLDVIDGAELIRAYFPQGVVTSVEAIAFNGTTPVSFGVTIEGELDPVKNYNFKSWMTALKTA